jgi:hypothetical protein
MKSTIRRLCREAIIFMLAGLVLVGVGGFIYVCLFEAKGLPTALQRAAVSVVLGLYGAAGAFCIWIFYRIVRFAVKR